MGKPGGPRADVYSFCVSLWEAFYGVRPYGAPLQRTEIAILEAIEAGRPALGRPLPGVPERMRDLLAKGLAASPSERYASMKEVLRALLDVVREPELAHARSRARWRRLAGVALLAIGIVAGAVLRGREPELTVVERALVLAHDEAADGSASSAVQYLELARKRAREDMDTEALRIIASEAEHIGHVLNERGEGLSARASWGVAHGILLELGDVDSRAMLLRLDHLLESAKKPG